MNLLLLLAAIGVVYSGIGENSLEYRAFLGSLTEDCLCNGVEGTCKLSSGRKAAMETRLLGWTACFVAVPEVGGGLAAMEILRGCFRKLFVLVKAFGFGRFSLSLADEDEALNTGIRVFCEVRGEDEGTIFVILRKGSLIFEGPIGGFFSSIGFRGACFTAGNEDCIERPVSARVSCFSLIFLSSASCCSSSRTYEKYRASPNNQSSQHAVQLIPNIRSCNYNSSNTGSL